MTTGLKSTKKGAAIPNSLGPQREPRNVATDGHTSVNARAKPSVDAPSEPVGLSRLIGQVETMVKESGDVKDFDSRSWLIQWLNQPMPALRGEKPMGYMGTPAGRKVVSKLLLRIQHGVFA